MKKFERHEAIRERARRAISNLYHNATVDYPSCPTRELADRCWAWFDDAASFEIQYLNDGGAYGKDYQKTLRADCNAGKYKSQKARDYYVRKGMREMREEIERCNKLDSREHAVNAMWQYITDYGRLYTWGRGGRTLAPEGLVKQHGGRGFTVDQEYAVDLPIANVVRLTRVVESFNHYVHDWCKDVPRMWQDQLDYERAERNAERKARKERAKKEAAERRFWAERDVATV